MVGPALNRAALDEVDDTVEGDGESLDRFDDEVIHMCASLCEHLQLRVKRKHMDKPAVEDSLTRQSATLAQLVGRRRAYLNKQQFVQRNLQGLCSLMRYPLPVILYPMDSDFTADGIPALLHWRPESAYVRIQLQMQGTMPDRDRALPFVPAAPPSEGQSANNGAASYPSSSVVRDASATMPTTRQATEVAASAMNVSQAAQPRANLPSPAVDRAVVSSWGSSGSSSSASTSSSSSTSSVFVDPAAAYLGGPNRYDRDLELIPAAAAYDFRFALVSKEDGTFNISRMYREQGSEAVWAQPLCLDYSSKAHPPASVTGVSRDVAELLRLQPRSKWLTSRVLHGCCLKDPSVGVDEVFQPYFDLHLLTSPVRSIRPHSSCGNWQRKYRRLQTH